jgi:hypothetical protein
VFSVSQGLGSVKNIARYVNHVKPSRRLYPPPDQLGQELKVPKSLGHPPTVPADLIYSGKMTREEEKKK